MLATNDQAVRVVTTMAGKTLPTKTKLKAKAKVRVRDNHKVKVNAKARVTDVAIMDRTTVEEVGKVASDRVHTKVSEEAVASGLVRLRLLNHNT